MGLKRVSQGGFKEGSGDTEGTNQHPKDSNKQQAASPALNSTFLTQRAAGILMLRKPSMGPFKTVAKAEVISDSGRGTLGARPKIRTIPPKTQRSRYKIILNTYTEETSRQDKNKARPDRAKRFTIQKLTKLEKSPKSKQHKPRKMSPCRSEGPS